MIIFLNENIQTPEKLILHVHYIIPLQSDDDDDNNNLYKIKIISIRYTVK